MFAWSGATDSARGMHVLVVEGYTLRRLEMQAHACAGMPRGRAYAYLIFALPPHDLIIYVFCMFAWSDATDSARGTHVLVVVGYTLRRLDMQAHASACMPRGWAYANLTGT